MLQVDSCVPSCVLSLYNAMDEIEQPLQLHRRKSSANLIASAIKMGSNQMNPRFRLWLLPTRMQLASPSFAPALLGEVVELVRLLVSATLLRARLVVSARNRNLSDSQPLFSFSSFFNRRPPKTHHMVQKAAWRKRSFVLASHSQIDHNQTNASLASSSKAARSLRSSSDIWA